MATMRAAHLAQISRRLAIYLLAGSSFLNAASARADGGGTLRQTVHTATMDLSIFTDPSPPQTGTVDINVVLQTIPPGVRQPAPGVQVCAYLDGDTEQKHCEPAKQVTAINTPFQVAQLELTQPGLWHVEVEIEADRPTVARFDLLVEEGYPRGASYVVWIALPALIVWLFAIHRRRVSRLQRAATAPKTDGM